MLLCSCMAACVHSRSHWLGAPPCAPLACLPGCLPSPSLLKLPLLGPTLLCHPPHSVACSILRAVATDQQHFYRKIPGLGLAAAAIIVAYCQCLVYQVCVPLRVRALGLAVHQHLLVSICPLHISCCSKRHHTPHPRSRPPVRLPACTRAGPVAGRVQRLAGRQPRCGAAHRPCCPRRQLALQHGHAGGLPPPARIPGGTLGSGAHRLAGGSILLGRNFSARPDGSVSAAGAHQTSHKAAHSASAAPAVSARAACLLLAPLPPHGLPPSLTPTCAPSRPLLCCLPCPAGWTSCPLMAASPLRRLPSP